MSERDSVFLRALGADAARLRPEVWEYVAGPPAGFRLGRGQGVFEIAGSPYRGLAGLLRIAVGPLVMLTRFERDVPFEIVNRPERDGNRLVLRAVRRFEFLGGAQWFADTLEAGREPGTLVNIPGPRKRLEMLLECSVTGDGNLQMRQRAARVRFGSRRLRLPRVLSVDIDVIDGWDAERERRTVDVRARNALLGTVLRYRGWFRYEYER